MRKEGDGRLHLKRVECLKKDERDSVKVNSFSFLFFLGEAIFFFLMLKIKKTKYYWFGKLWEVQNSCDKLSWGQQKIKHFQFYSIT